MRKLHRNEFTSAAHNAGPTSGVGTGKTQLATVVNVQAIQKHARQACFLSPFELVNILQPEKAHIKAS